MGNPELTVQRIRDRILLCRVKAKLMPKKEKGATSALNMAADTMEYMLEKRLETKEGAK